MQPFSLETLEDDNSLTNDKVIELNNSLIKASSDDTPTLITDTKDNITVLGDANKTERKSYSYKIIFELPREKFENKVKSIGGTLLKENETTLYVEKTFSNVFINARQRIRVQKFALTFLTFYVKETDGGKKIEDTNNEVLLNDLVNKVIDKDELLLSIYNLVGSYLNLDDETQSYMSFASTFENALLIIQNDPSLFNETNNELK
jgi:hypothetical protein